MARSAIILVLLLSATCFASANLLGVSLGVGAKAGGSGSAGAGGIGANLGANLGIGSKGVNAGVGANANVGSAASAGVGVNASAGTGGISAAIGAQIQAGLVAAVKGIADVNFRVFPILLASTVNLGAELKTSLSNITILVPTNAAVTASALASLSLSDLKVLLSSHIILGNYPLSVLAKLQAGTVLPTLSGLGLAVNVLANGQVALTVAGLTATTVAAVVKANVGASVAPLMLGVSAVLNANLA